MQYKFLRFPGGKTKAVTFSYDDGNKADIRLADTLTKYGLKGTFNLNSCNLYSENKISIEEIRTHLLDAGHEVAVHGEFHKALGLCSPLDGIRDVLNCRLELEKTFGRIIRGMAYADSGIRNIQYGTDYEKIKQYLSDLGIAYSRTLGGDNDSFMLPHDWHAWIPTVHHDNPQALEYAEKFLEVDCDKQYCSRMYPRLYYVWGHSFEFDRKNNWERLDALCERLSGHEDIWYATNIEIYDYVEAFHTLVFSADSKIVYNPTLVKIWFNIDKQEYSIEPGQTLVLK
ncbi:MAG: polysaccharide deacetylase family protein [Lachnospiraceae bacterium]|nr:polysaccharide deacetylase family protein [Lachnospiraceae bacterium]MBR3808030.1 polysaccharide deacetylase family protein [Lachnospiraceae bacterium]MBR4060974.1 polysaccharide deacetylase family protein [Lachnospiraceae bacterium]